MLWRSFLIFNFKTLWPNYNNDLCSYGQLLSLLYIILVNPKCDIGLFSIAIYEVIALNLLCFIFVIRLFCIAPSIVFYLPTIAILCTYIGINTERRLSTNVQNNWYKKEAKRLRVTTLAVTKCGEQLLHGEQYFNSNIGKNHNSNVSQKNICIFGAPI